MPGMGGMPGLGGMPPGMNPEVMSKLMSDPELMAAMQNPKVIAITCLEWMLKLCSAALILVGATEAAYFWLRGCILGHAGHDADAVQPCSGNAVHVRSRGWPHTDEDSVNVRRQHGRHVGGAQQHCSSKQHCGY